MTPVLKDLTNKTHWRSIYQNWATFLLEFPGRFSLQNKQKLNICTLLGVEETSKKMDQHSSNNTQNPPSFAPIFKRKWLRLGGHVKELLNNITQLFSDFHLQREPTPNNLQKHVETNEVSY